MIEAEGLCLLTDPGKWSRGFEEADDIDIVLITHEHADHLHTESLRQVLAKNPAAEVIANSAVGLILNEAGIDCTILEGKDGVTREGVAIEACDGRHAEIFGDIGQVQNTGYFIADSFFYPGDSFTDPGKQVATLALPVAGPWCKAPDAIRYAILLKPRQVLPIHDAVLSEEGLELTHGLFENVLAQEGIKFLQLEEGKAAELD